ncbi:MAG: LysE family transporter [Bacillus subtilis]|nr:LysE family transporter [Bacillus subtilis]
MGPIAFAMISKGFKNEIKEGQAIAVGAAFMDFFYCLIAFSGISLIISFFPSVVGDFYTKNSNTIEIILTFAGCVIVVIYGLKIMRSKITYDKLEKKESSKLDSAAINANKLKEKANRVSKILKVPEKSKSTFIGLFFMGVMLCLSSISLPASWIALIGYLKGFSFLDSSFLGGFLFSVGAFVGTFGWFYALLKLITGNKKLINQSTINILNIVAGIILLTLGVFLFFKALISVIQ